jgi:hypothetical protein
MAIHRNPGPEKLMLRFAIALAMIPALGAAAPARAAAVETLGCVEATLPPAMRAGLIANVETNMRNAAGEQNYAPEVITAMNAAADTCAATNGWSPEARVAALLYTLPKVGWAKATELARGAGLNIRTLEARFMALPDAERIDALNEGVLGKLATAAVEAGEVKEANAEMAGAIFGLLAVREKALSDFKIH